jgi:hypothetical protein
MDAFLTRDNSVGSHGSGYKSNHFDQSKIAIFFNSCPGRFVDSLIKDLGSTGNETGSLNIVDACLRWFFFFRGTTTFFWCL